MQKRGCSQWPSLLKIKVNNNNKNKQPLKVWVTVLSKPLILMGRQANFQEKEK